MTTITFEEELITKKKSYKSVGDFINELVSNYEKLEDKALLDLSIKSDKGDYADIDSFYGLLKK